MFSNSSNISWVGHWKLISCSLTCWPHSGRRFKVKSLWVMYSGLLRSIAFIMRSERSFIACISLLTFSISPYNYSNLLTQCSSSCSKQATNLSLFNYMHLRYSFSVRVSSPSGFCSHLRLSETRTLIWSVSSMAFLKIISMSYLNNLIPSILAWAA